MMALEFKFPDVGEGIHEGEIVRWRVKVGDTVKEDQVLVEMETAKAIVEIPSPKAGTILAVNGKEGQTINVGDVLVVIGEKGEKVGAANVSSAVKDDAAPGVVGKIPTDAGVSLPARRSETQTGAVASGAIPVMPRVRKLAQDLKVDLSKMKGTGPGGQITEDDVRASVQPTFGGPVERVQLKGLRKVVAENMVKSKSVIPHVTHMDEFDATALIKLRESKKPEAEKRGIKLTYLAFIVKAAVEALKKHPTLNAFVDDSLNEIVYKKYYNIGIAVDMPDGLMAPVIKDADKKDVLEIAKEIVELAQKCRDRKVELHELQDGTFTVTNIGSVGGIMATPIIVHGESAILGTFKMKEKPVAINGKVEVRPMMSLTITYDHRLVDGAEGARFMNDLMEGLVH